MSSTRFPLVRTVRFRITAVAAVAVGLVLVVAAFALVANQRRQLTATLDNTLEQRVDDIVAANGFGPLDEGSLAGPRSEDRLAQIVNDRGEVVAATANVAGDPPAVPLPEEGQRFTSVERLPIEADRFRVIARRVPTDEGSEVVIVAENSEDLEESVEALRRNLAVMVPLTVLVLVAIVWLLVGRTLRPVEAIRRRVSAIGATELDRRVPESRTGDEIDRLARTMNEMLDRLEDGAARQRRFVADTSHELRTPLTRMRTMLDVDAAVEAGDAREDAATRASLHEEVIGLQRTVEDLLVLADADADTSAIDRAPVDLDDLVGREVRRIRTTGRVSVDMSDVSGAHLSGDRHQLGRLVRNLLDNAVRHAVGEVRVACRDVEAGTVVLEVDDDGPGIAPEDRERVFERFARLDAARSDAAGGTGLGLAIAREIAVAHGGSIAISDAPSGGARFTVSLPAGTHGQPGSDR